jgi:DNA-binding NtrC family response regulator
VVAAGRFREDLYYRLNGITLSVPPLRERKADLEPLVRRFARAAARDEGHDLEPSIAPEFLAVLSARELPGNVRELKNLVTRAVVLAGGGPLTGPLLSKLLARPGEEPAAPLRDDVEAFERRRILHALDQAGGNQTHAARLLGIGRRTLIDRLEKYAIPRPRKRPKR